MVYFIVLLIPIYFIGKDNLWDKYPKKVVNFFCFIAIVFTLFGLTPKLFEMSYYKYIDNNFVNAKYAQYEQCSNQNRYVH